ncbi:MAG: DUF4301 family protein [Deltaproteobacteria bacterium]|nr:DUF4301 family protein [Deltaproteobacteria bacterium]
MHAPSFTDRDIKQINEMGITLKDVLSQIEMFKKGAPYVKLIRPCTVNDGIKVFDEEEQKKLKDIYNRYAPEMEIIKFVPASGAASRMFRTLIKFNNKYREINRYDIESTAKSGDKEAQYILEFMDGIYKFPFIEDIDSVMSKNGLDMDALIKTGEFKQIIDFFITEKGLGYANLPKGLIKFHRYRDRARTAFEEHLAESSGYIKDKRKQSCLHFTVSPEHMEKFHRLLDEIQEYYEKLFEMRLDVSFSIQKKQTDTIAVDMDNRPFRLDDGSLLFRPSGHGALIENLNSIDKDIIFIKNIDNVVPDRLKHNIFLWKHILGGKLIQTQQKIFYYIKKLKTDNIDKVILNEAAEFIRTELSVLPEPGNDLTLEEKRDIILEKLNRPLRVCGMVKNVGEPGGGPFWVEDNGSISIQIVEGAQVSPFSEEQQKILASSTHFNPVDIACSIKNWQGKPFDLKKYVDSRAVLISQKSKEGRDLKALELPGLWNGGMAYWNTVFVEVPLITFNPVKTVNDLLRKEHQ